MRTLFNRPVVIGFRLLTALMIAFGGQILTVSPVSAKPTQTIVDTLGAATPSTQFNLAGSGGQAVTSFQLVGPKFVLTQSTMITEIGAFVTYCELLGGVVNCPSTQPISVQIRPANNGQPDTNIILATYILSQKHDPQFFSYEAARVHLKLEPGTYFAIFAPQGDGAAGLLSSASDPFAYQAGSAEFGWVFPSEGTTAVTQLNLAVRILGKPVHEK